LENDSQSAIRPFLAAQSTLSLATVDDSGQPQAAPLFYVSDDALNLYWLSSPTSRHSINLAAQPRVAATIYPAVWAWTDISGLQIEGSAHSVTDSAERERILTLYRAKFPLPPAFDAQIAASTLYRLTPTRVRWLDNSIRFGYKVDFSI
jgi:uncharacterized protein